MHIVKDKTGSKKQYYTLRLELTLLCDYFIHLNTFEKSEVKLSVGVLLQHRIVVPTRISYKLKEVIQIVIGTCSIHE
jgi:hypothetical protein